MAAGEKAVTAPRYRYLHIFKSFHRFFEVYNFRRFGEIFDAFRYSVSTCLDICSVAQLEASAAALSQGNTFDFPGSLKLQPPIEIVEESSV